MRLYDGAQHRLASRCGASFSKSTQDAKLDDNGAVHTVQAERSATQPWRVKDRPRPGLRYGGARRTGSAIKRRRLDRQPGRGRCRGFVAEFWERGKPSLPGAEPARSRSGKPPAPGLGDCLALAPLSDLISQLPNGTCARQRRPVLCQPERSTTYARTRVGVSFTRTFGALS